MCGKLSGFRIVSFDIYFNRNCYSKDCMQHSTIDYKQQNLMADADGCSIF